jgi:tetratricopeptide (TPR) repeat protein
MLWPEHDEVGGRRALRNAFYTIRRELGAEVIVSAGDHLVGIDPAYLACDAVQLERGGAAPATLADGGEPLRGLHVDGALEFDQWMSAERDRLIAVLAQAQRSPSLSRGVAIPALVEPRTRPHSQDAAAMYLRGHYLFLRSAHGGPGHELLSCRDYYERACALDATFAPAVAGLANFYAVAARRGVLTPFHEHFATAIKYSERALAMDDALAVPHTHFAVKALYLDDDWDRAGQEFATAVSKDPEYAEGHRFYGVWLGLVGRHGEALREMEEAARIEPGIPHILSSLGAARLAVGDREGAEEAMRRTLVIDPAHPPARDRLVRLLDASGRVEEAIAERCRTPAMHLAEEFRAAHAHGGSAAYDSVRDRQLRAEIAALESRLVERHQPTTNDIFSPPLVRLVELHLRRGDEKRARVWELQGIAERPAFAKWFAAVRQSLS